MESLFELKIQASFDQLSFKCLICQKSNQNKYQAANHVKKHHRYQLENESASQAYIEENKESLLEPILRSDEDLSLENAVTQEITQVDKAQKYRKAFNMSLRGSISKRLGNIQIVSIILQFTYDLDNLSQIKNLVGCILYKNIPLKLKYKETQNFDNNSDFLAQSADKLNHIEQLANVFKSIIDICSKCYRINTVCFKDQKLLCPLCLNPMVNFNSYKFSMLKKYQIQIIDSTIIDLHIQSRRQILKISNPQTTRCQFLKESITGDLYQFNFTRTPFKPINLSWNQGNLHGNCIITDKNNCILQYYKFEHGLQHGECIDYLNAIKHQSINLQIYSFDNIVWFYGDKPHCQLSTYYQNGLKNGTQTVQNLQFGKLSQFTYQNNLKHGSFFQYCICQNETSKSYLSGNYLYDQLDGLIQIFNQDNQLIKKFNFKNGLLDGEVHFKIPTSPNLTQILYQFQDGLQISKQEWGIEAGKHYMFVEKHYIQEFKKEQESWYYPNQKLKRQVTPMPHGTHNLFYQYVETEHGIQEHVRSSFKFNPDYISRITKYTKTQLKVLF